MSKIGNYSENEDDPEPYESSGDEWSEPEPQKKKNTALRRNLARTSKKKPRIDNSSDSNGEEEQLPPVKPRPRNGVKKQRVDGKKTVPRVISSNDFSTGSFLVSKKDAQVGDPNKHPCIWRVDGKALLQKYEAFDDCGMVRHKTTSVYTGWSSLDRDQYLPVTVTVHQQVTNQTMIVNLDWEKLKEDNDNDSD